MARIKLNNKQKEKVENWQFLLGTRSRIVKLIDRTCGYKDAYLEWQKQLNQPNSQIAIINYITRLELTKGGGLRVEETKLSSIDYIQGCIEGEIIPLLPELPPLPLRKVDESLYPRDKKEALAKERIQILYWLKTGASHLMISLNTQVFLSLSASNLTNSEMPKKYLDFSSHPQWNHQTGWKNALNNFRLIIQPSILLWSVFPWLEIFPDPDLLLGFHRLIHIMNQFQSLTLSG